MCYATEERSAEPADLQSIRREGAAPTKTTRRLTSREHPSAKLELTHAACERSDSRKRNALQLQGVSFSPQRQIAPR